MEGEMDATEISGQVVGLIAGGEWGQAARLVNEQWNEASEFGTYHCELPEFAEAWVRFNTTGYPFKLRRQMEEAANDREVLLLILPRVAEWAVQRADGQPMPAPAECLARPESLDE